MRIYNSEQMRAIDMHAIDKVGIPSLVLMENAGIKSLFTMEKLFSGLNGKRFTIVCGKGNNGGDGLVIARHLANSNLPVCVFLTDEPEKLSKDAAVNYDILCKTGIKPAVIHNEDDINRLRIAMEFSDCLIECMFGTGFRGEIEGKLAGIIEAMNDSKAKKVAIDLPSGLCATSGKTSKVCFKADFCISLGAPKIGMFLYPGKDITGEVWVADIGIPEVSFATVADHANLVTSQLSQTLLPPKSPCAHKGTNGKLLILAGSNQYSGAAVITSYGALRSGAGIVTLAMPESLKGNLSFQLLPETILDFMPCSDGKFNLTKETVESLNSRYRTILAGPGWGRSKETEESVKALITNWEGHLVLDADALNSLKQPDLLKEAKQIALITPHLTEMSRLTGKSIEEVQENQLEIAAKFARDNRTIVVLKSAVTVIADHHGRLYISSRPNPGLARGGSGDLLAGLIAGLATTGISPLNAAIAGVHLLADSAEFAVAELGFDAVTVSEIASFIPRAFKKLRQELPEPKN